MKFLFDNFDILAQSPNGVKKLREMILQLAVQGKLVPQNPNDEPASVLLEKIKKEKKQLLKEGKIKKQKPLVPIKEDEIPFELPTGWMWSELASLGLINPRNVFNDNEEASFVPMPLIFSEYGKPIQSQTREWNEIKKGFTHFIENDVSLAKITPCFENRKSAVMKNLTNGIGAGTTELHIFRSLGNTMIPEYILIFLKTPLFVENGKKTMTGSAGQKRVPKDYFSYSKFPLPPLSEQKRIVTKVDSLMALCDDLEKQQQEKAEKKLKLNKASLHELHSSTTKHNFNKNWNHITKNFDLLYNTLENVNDLKQSILQLAVQGKLVPQNPNDELASVLLEKIKEEKEQLLKEGKIKKQKPLEPIKESEVPFELPERWLWVRLGTILYITSGKNLTSKQMQAGEIPVYGGNGVTGYHNIFNIGKKTLVIGRVGFYCGSIHITPEKAWVTDNAFRTVFSEQNINIDFLSILLRTFDLKSNENATAQPVISGKKIYPILLPLPPFTEQKRIVAKIDVLMALCNQLSQKIVDKAKYNENLLNAVVSQL